MKQSPSHIHQASAMTELPQHVADYLRDKGIEGTWANAHSKWQTNIVHAPHQNQLRSALRSYTDGSYSQMNRLLRGSPVHPQLVKYTKNRVEFAKQAIKSSPPFVGTVHRGVAFKDESEFRKFVRKHSIRKVGNRVSFPEFLSTSLDPKRPMKHILAHADPYDVAHSVVLEMQTHKNNAYIKHPDLTAYPNEHEILIHPESKWVVKDYKKEQNSTGIVHRVVLKQL